VGSEIEDQYPNAGPLDRWIGFAIKIRRSQSIVETSEPVPPVYTQIGLLIVVAGNCFAIQYLFAKGMVYAHP
jgi:hypothetical protein